MNGLLVGDYISSHNVVRPSSSISVSGMTPPTGSNFLVKIILLLLASLLVANMLLFFRLANLVKYNRVYLRIIIHFLVSQGMIEQTLGVPGIG